MKRFFQALYTSLQYAFGGTEPKKNTETEMTAHEPPRKKARIAAETTLPFTEQITLMPTIGQDNANQEESIESSPTPVLQKASSTKKRRRACLKKKQPDPTKAKESADRRKRLKKTRKIDTSKLDIPQIKNRAQPFYVLDEEVISTKKFCEDLHIVSQIAIENFYLKPFLKRKSRNDLKNGVIEREIHGGMHASRVARLVTILHQKLKEMFPSTVLSILNELSQDLNLSEEQIIVLNSFAGLCHDSGREGDNADCHLWEEKSGSNCSNMLKKHKIPSELAELFAALIIYKDKPHELQLFLLKKGIPAEKISNYQYLRKLIYLADCFDIMRCNGGFDLKYVFSGLEDISEFNKERHAEKIIEFAKHVLDLIHSQKDMLYNCVILLDGKQTRYTQESNYSLAAKVKFEHADNILSLMTEDMRKNPYFAEYMCDIPYSFPIFSNVVPAFNPLIHGTSSIIFALLSKVDFTLYSAIDMLEKYHLAPFGGEISKGGYSTMDARCNTCLARMKPKSDVRYNLNKVMSDYAVPQKITKESIEVLLRKEIEESFRSGFSNINILIIYLARAKQIGAELNPEEERKLIDCLGATIQFYYLWLLIGKLIYPNYDLVNSFSKTDKAKMGYATFFYFNFSTITQKIVESSLDIKDIYEYPTEEKLRKALTLLELPERIVIDRQNTCGGSFFGESMFSLEEEEDEGVLPVRQLFTLDSSAKSLSKTDESYKKNYNFFWVTNNHCGGMGAALMSYLENDLLMNHNIEIITKYIADLSIRGRMLIDIIRQDPANMQCKENERFLQNTFPLILILEQDEMAACYNSSGEYRAKSPLKIGKDIKMIATKTEIDRLKLMKYLEQHYQRNIVPILFNDLMQRQSERELDLPSSPYTHSDGFPRLTWLAARKYNYNEGDKHNNDSDFLIASAAQYRLLN